jgi:CheY-like chemotaxis protein
MSQRILVVEDDEDNITIIADILKLVLHQRELLFARNGHEAIRMAQQYRPDLILMDLTLPDLSGWDAARTLKGDVRFQDTPILALTANAMVGDRERALDAGCDDYLPKPTDVDGFIDFLGRYVQTNSSHGRVAR